MTKKHKRRPQDTTLRNTRASRRRDAVMAERLTAIVDRLSDFENQTDTALELLAKRIRTLEEERR